MKRLFVMVVVVLAFSQVSLWAQDVPSAELFGGFSWLSVEGSPDRFNPLGWQASVAFNGSGAFGIVGDFGGQYKDGVSAHQFMGGIRGNARGERANIFAHALAGATRFANGGSSTDFTLGFGGGVDVNAGDRIAIRIVQFDWLPVKFDSGWESNMFRMGFGIVFKGAPR